MEKHERRPVAGAKEARASSANFRWFLLYNSPSRILVSNVAGLLNSVIPVETGIQVLGIQKFNLDARVREHDALYSQLICGSPIRRRRIDVNIP